MKSGRSSYCECGCELAGKLGSLKSLFRSPSSISLSSVSFRITLDGSSPMVCQCRRRCDCSPPRLIFPFDLHNPPDHASDFTTTDCASQAQRNLSAMVSLHRSSSHWRDSQCTCCAGCGLKELTQMMLRRQRAASSNPGFHRVPQMSNRARTPRWPTCCRSPTMSASGTGKRSCFDSEGTKRTSRSYS